MNISLSCAICMEAYVEREPVALPCGHVFCLSCIQALRDTGSNIHNLCPICRKEYAMYQTIMLKGLGSKN